MRRPRSGPTREAARRTGFVIEFRNAHFSGDTTRRVDFNAVLFENGEILTQYRNIAADGRERGTQPLGIENHTGTDALGFSFNEASLANEPTMTSVPLPAAAAAAVTHGLGPRPRRGDRPSPTRR